MTDRVDILHVALEQDIRIDDVQPLITAIKHMRGVANVETHVRDFYDYAAREQLYFKWAEIMWQVIRALRDGRQITIEPQK